jgi:probable F420-dependent oxidoreductase
MSQVAAGRRIELGLYITHANELLGPDLSGLVEVAARIDAAGIDYLTVADHVLLGTDMRGHEALGGALPFPADEPYPDPLVTLAAVAAVTSRVRLATGILVAPLRSAPVLAKMAATVDVLSQGRLDLGVGSGWQEAEFEAVGVPVAEKTARLEDTVRACQELWRRRPASYSSPFVSFLELCCAPPPTHGDIPVWFAGRPNPATVRRIATLGAGWLPLGPLDPDAARAARTVIDDACRSVGRDPVTVGVRMPGSLDRDDAGDLDTRSVADQLLTLSDAGVTGVHFPLARLARDLDALDRLLEQLQAVAEELVPE